MRAILIDPENKTTKEFDIDLPKEGNRLKPFYDLIGCRLCETIDLGKDLCLVIDEEGLLSANHHFRIIGWSNAPIAGKAVMMRRDGAGELMPLQGLTAERLALYLDWLGDDNGLEEAIVAGRIERPVTTFATSFEPNAPKEILWSWSPNS